MYFVYVLVRNNNTNYVGRTMDLKRRLSEHKNGKTRSTRGMKPKLIFYEAYINDQDAIAREAYFKTGDGRQELKKLLKNSLHGSIV